MSRLSENLHSLIKSLNKAEKRYFKLHSERHTIGEVNNYVRLFDAVEAQEVYDEEALLKHFKKEAFAKNFFMAKSRLYDAIMKSLDAYHTESSADARLKQQLHYVEILYKKALYDQANKVLEKVKKQALDNDQFHALLQVSKWEKLLIETHNYSGQTEEKIMEILTDDLLLIEKLKNFSQFWNIKSRLFMILNNTGKARDPKQLEKFKKIIDNTLLNSEEQALSVRSKYLFNHIYSAYYFGTSNYKECYKYLQKNVELIESHFEHFSDELNIYFSLLTNIIYVGQALKKNNEVDLYLGKLRAMPEKMGKQTNDDLAFKWFNSAYSIELSVYFERAEFERCLKLIPEIEQGIKKYQERISALRKAYFYFNIAIVYFALENYHLASRWINKLLNDQEIEKNLDVYCFAKIFSLVIQIELGDEQRLPHALRATQRFLEKKQKVYKFETMMLDFVGKMLGKQSRSDLKASYSKLLRDLKALRYDNFEKTVFDYFDLISWVESKVNNRSFIEIMEDKNK